MRKLLFVILTLLSISCYGQYLSPVVVASAGKTTTSGTVSMAFTIGQVAVVPFESSVASTPGFHQPLPEIFVSTFSLSDKIVISAFPNPTKESLSIVIQAITEDNNYSLSAFNIAGQQFYLPHEITKQSDNYICIQVNVKQLQAGLYLFRVLSEKHPHGLKNLRVVVIK